MKLIYKICLMNVGLVLLLAAVLTPAFFNGSMAEAFSMFGILSVLGSVVNLLIGLLLLLLRRKQWGQGYLLSAGVLLLLGCAVCTPLLIG